MSQLLDFDLNRINDHKVRYNKLGAWKQSGDIMRLDTVPNSRNQHQAEIEIPGGHSELWLTYRVRFKDAAAFGRNQKAHSVGGKMPGLGSSGNSTNMSAGHTGGTHNDQGFSGRLMWRGHNAEGINWKPATGFTLSLYAYRLGGRRSYWFRETNPTNAVPRGVSKGTGPGNIGDTDAWILPIGEWITVTLGYTVGKNNHGFTAFTSTESDPVPQLRLQQTHAGGWRWMADSARQTIDSFLFQSYYGGSTELWLPDKASALEYSDVSIHSKNPLIPTQPDPAPAPPIITPPPTSTPIEPSPETPAADRIRTILEGLTFEEKIEAIAGAMA